MAVGFLPYGWPKHKFETIAEMKLPDIQWPLGDSYDDGVVGDLTARDHLVMCVSSRALLARRQGVRCKLSLALMEPPAIQGRYYRIMPYVAGRFHRIFTYNAGLLRRLPNARFQAHGGCLVDRPIKPTEKVDLISLIASKKKSTAGHRLRHRIAHWSREIAPHLALVGRGYRPLEKKADGLLPFMYSVVIENCREPGYFTEKLIDCLLCGCVPIYWGAPDIGAFFHPQGIIHCDSETAIQQAVLAVNEEDYAARLPFLLENQTRAEAFIDARQGFAQYLASEDIYAARAAA